MEQRGLRPLEGLAQKAVWVVAVACAQSVLIAVPTITLSLQSPSIGIPVEGIPMESLREFGHWDSSEDFDTMTASPFDALWRSGIFEKSHTGTIPGVSSGTDASSPPYNLHFISPDGTRAVIQTDGTPAEQQLASSALWAEMTAYRSDGTLQLPHWDWGQYR